MQKSLSQELATFQSVNLYNWSSIFPDPDSVLASQGRGISLYRELLTDPHVRACTMSRKAGVLGQKYGVVGDEAYAAMITGIFDGLDLNQIISDILNAPLFGFQPIEVVWNFDGAGVLPIKVEAKPQEWFSFDLDNNLRLKTAANFYEGVVVPDRKFLLPRNNPSYTNPYGEKLLSSVFWPVTFKKGGLKFWVSFTEKYGMPWALGRIPRQTLAEEAIALRDALDNMVQDGVAVFDDSCSVELVESSSKDKSSAVYSELVNFNNDEISKAILGQTLTTQVGSNGSYAAGKVHSDVRDDILASDVRLVEKTVNQLIDWILELNFPSAVGSCHFVFADSDNIKADLAARDKVLHDAGLDLSQEYFSRTYGFTPDDFAS